MSLLKEVELVAYEWRRVQRRKERRHRVADALKLFPWRRTVRWMRTGLSQRDNHYHLPKN